MYASTKCAYYTESCRDCAAHTYSETVNVDLGMNDTFKICKL